MRGRGHRGGTLKKRGKGKGEGERGTMRGIGVAILGIWARMLEFYSFIFFASSIGYCFYSEGISFHLIILRSEYLLILKNTQRVKKSL